MIDDCMSDTNELEIYQLDHLIAGDASKFVEKRLPDNCALIDRKVDLGHPFSKHSLSISRVNIRKAM